MFCSTIIQIVFVLHLHVNDMELQRRGRQLCQPAPAAPPRLAPPLHPSHIPHPGPPPQHHHCQKKTSPDFAEVLVEDLAEDLVEVLVEALVEDLSFFPLPPPLAPSFLGCAFALALDEGLAEVGVCEERPLPLVDCLVELPDFDFEGRVYEESECPSAPHRRHLPFVRGCLYLHSSPNLHPSAVRKNLHTAVSIAGVFLPLLGVTVLAATTALEARST